MKPEAGKLREEVNRLKKEYDSAEKRLEAFERNCRHEWGEIEYCPEHIPAYTIPGDPPGTMGVDWRGPCHVPSETIDRWRRVCRICGRVETTDRADIETTAIKKPRF